jgi:hypothetical protein
MVLGNPQKIDLGTSSFEAMRSNDNLYIDKTRFIEHFLNESNSIQLIVRPRRLGKSLNLDMLRCFLTDKEDCRHLFERTYIRNSDLWNHANSAPVFYFDFKNLNRDRYKEQIHSQIVKQIYDYIDIDSLRGYSKYCFDKYLSDDGSDTNGLLILTQIVREMTGKSSYILIDEYDKLLTDNYNNDAYDSIKEFETSLLSAGLKGNNCLKKALMTGVMRVSRESILSGLNNLQTYDVFTDNLYTDDFGLSDLEIDQLRTYIQFNKTDVKSWYNGVKINGEEIYNIFSVLSYLKGKQLANYWGRSGAIDIIVGLMNEYRMEVISRLLNEEVISVYIKDRISIHELADDPETVFSIQCWCRPGICL